MTKDTAIPTNILDLLDFYNIEYKKIGSVYMAHCIFHPGDNTPSMAIYPQTNTVFCFGCLQSGTIETVVMQMEKCSYAEAVKMIYGNGYEWQKLKKETKNEPKVDEAYLYNILGRNLKKEIRKSIDFPEKVNKFKQLIMNFSHNKVEAKDLFKTLRLIKEASK